MPRPTEKITEYPEWTDEMERQRRALIDSLERDEDDIFDSKKQDSNKPNYYDSKPTRVQDSRYPDYQDRKYQDLYDKRPDNVRDRQRNELRDRTRADNTAADTRRAGSGGYSDSSRASASGRPPGREIISVDAPPNRMAMPVGIVPPQRDLVPLWDGAPIYGTPENPASPLDCNRFSSSPYCGGNPFDWKPIGIDFDAVNDGGSAVNKEGCNIGIQITPVVAFIKLPPIQIVARNPWCKPEPPLPPPPEDELPEGYEFDLGAEGVTQYLEFAYVSRITNFGFACFFNDPSYPEPQGLISWDGTPANGGNSQLWRWLITGIVKITVGYLRWQPIGNGRSFYLATSCHQVAHSSTSQWDGYGKIITIRNGTNLLFQNRIHTNPKYYTHPGVIIVDGGSITHRKVNRTFNISVLRLDNIPLDVDRYNYSPPPPPPWEPPPPPPEPRQRRDDPEECECMCCNDGNTEALIAMLMQQLANQAGQIANLQQQVTASTNTIINNMKDCDLLPVLEETSIIKNRLAATVTSAQLTQTEQRLSDKIGDVKVDLNPVLAETQIIKEKLDEVDEQIDQLTTNLGEFPGVFGDFEFESLTEFLYKIYLALFDKQDRLVALIGEPLEIELYDESVEQHGVQGATTTPGTLFEAITLGTKRGEVGLKAIGIEQYPITYKVNDEDKEINNLSSLVWAIAKIIPLEMFPRTAKWEGKDGTDYELKFETLGDIILKLVGLPKEVFLFDEDKEKEGRQPKAMMPMTLFELIALNFARTEILAEVIGIDMFPITLKPQMSEEVQVNWNVLSDERNILHQALDLLGTIDPVSWILDFSGTLQGTFDLAEDAWKWLKEYIEMYTDEKKLTNLVELQHFTRQLIVEAVDDNEFPIVVEKEQFGGEQDLAFESPADAIEEVLILLYNLAKTNGYQTDIGLKTLAESVHTKAISAMVQGEVRNIADFLDYPTNAVIRPLKIHINCPAKELADGDVDLDGAEDLDKFLTESQIDITFDEWTGKKSHTDMMRDLLNQAASARGDATRK